MKNKIRTWFVTNEFWPKANEQHYAFKFKPPESQYGKTFEVVMKSDYDLLMKDVEGLIEALNEILIEVGSSTKANKIVMKAFSDWQSKYGNDE